MLRNPYFQLICAIFRVINALRNRNDSFDCHALTSQSKVSTHAVCAWVCTRVRESEKMRRNPYFQLICAIFRVINALRNRNDSFDCHALTSQSKVSSRHMLYSIWVGMYAVRVTGNMTRTHA